MSKHADKQGNQGTLFYSIPFYIFNIFCEGFTFSLTQFIIFLLIINYPLSCFKFSHWCWLASGINSCNLSNVTDRYQSQAVSLSVLISDKSNSLHFSLIFFVILSLCLKISKLVCNVMWEKSSQTSDWILNTFRKEFNSAIHTVLPSVDRTYLSL